MFIGRGLYEFFTMLEKKGIKIYKYVGIGVGLVIPISIMTRFELTKNWELLLIVLDVMMEMAHQGITMVCVTHEMGFAKAVADRVIFMDQGQIVEQNNPHEFFNNPQSERSRDFLSKILGH